jgi:hypothetical protein
MTGVDPMQANKRGDDTAICGNCPRRNGACYVNLGQAPLRVFRSAPATVAAPGSVVDNATVRLGAYGDPAAAPYEFWNDMLKPAAGWFGYTHQWATCDQRMKKFCMASVESLAEQDHAHDLGWRTFRVGTSISDRGSRESLCPASEESESKITCIQCQHCSGLGRGRTGDVFIPVHGTARNRQAHTRILAEMPP